MADILAMRAARPKPSAGVYVYKRKRKDAAGKELTRWVVEHRRGEREPKSYRVFETKTEADEYAQALRDDIRAAATVVGDKTTVQQAWDRYMKWAATRLRPGTLQTYADAMAKHVLPALADVPVRELSSVRVRQLIDDLLAAGGNPKTVKNAIGTLRSALGLLVDEGVLASNPASIRRGWIKHEVPDPEVLAKRELHLFLEAAAREPYYCAILFLALTGARLGEMMALQWADVDLDARTARIRRAVRLARESQPKTKFGLRTIDLPPKLAVEMAKLPSRSVALADPNYLVFPQSAGGYLNARHLHYVFARVCKRAGIKRIHPHALRHTWATLMLNQGAPLNYVSRALGHHSAAFTAAVYAKHYHAEKGHEDAARLADAVLPDDVNEA